MRLFKNRGAICGAFSVIMVFFGSPATLKAETVYFLVGEIYPVRYDCYVLPLTNPSDIAYARLLIAEGPYGPNTLAAYVGAAIDQWDPNNGININRNYLQPGIPAWSWYVTEFQGFWESSAEILDGCPTGIEDDHGLGLPGAICFWSYTVIAELGTDLEPWKCDLTVDGSVNIHDFAQFSSHWLDSGCSHRFYCEGTDIDGSGEVDFADFATFVNNWLWNQ